MRQLQRKTSSTAVSPPAVHGGVLRRKCDCGQHTVGGTKCEACARKQLQRAARYSSQENSTAGSVPSIVHDVLRSPGQPLSAQTRSFFEPRLGCDFSQIPAHATKTSVPQGKLTVNSPGDPYERQADQMADKLLRTSHPAGNKQTSSYDLSQVRVHADDKAAKSATMVHALAYTVGRDVVFGRGQYIPDTDAGKRLLAHELTHVAQQNGAPAAVQRFSTEDCDSADVTRIDESHNRAIEIVEAAIARLEASPVTATTQTHFANHFGAYAEWRRDIVLSHFKRDLSLLKASDMTYECESECDEGEPAYTYWIFGDIHICLPWLRSEGLTERGETFIHEMHHWDAGRGHLDLGYHKNNEDNHTTWLVAVNNADAYSELAQDLYEQP